MGKAFTVPFRPSDIPTGLQGYWKFNNDATDSSGNGYDLTAVNSPTYTANGNYWKDEYCGVMNGSNQEFKITTCPNLNVSTAVTISAWVKTTADSQDCIAGKWLGTGNQQAYLLQVIPSAPQKINFVWSTNGSTVSSMESSSTFNYGKWTHIVVVYDSSSVRLFVNGNLDNTASSTGSLFSSSADFVIGRANASDGYFGGSIKDVAIWNVALTPIQIKSLALGVDLTNYAYRPSDVSTAPTHWWKLNEVSGKRLDSIYTSTDTSTSIVPEMTSNTAPQGATICVGSAVNDYVMFTATGSDVSKSDAFPQYWGYEFGVGVSRIVNAYAIKTYTASGGYAPKDFTFEASNDNSAWTTLDTQMDLSWSANEEKVFSFTNTTAYRYYRIKVTESTSGGTQTIISRIKFCAGYSLLDPSTTASSGGYIEGVAADFSSDYLRASDSADWDVGTGDFTISFWAKHDTSVNGRYIFSQGSSPTIGLRYVSGEWDFYLGGSVKSAVTYTQPLNVWEHYCIRRSGTSLKFFIDGVEKDSDVDSTNSTGGATVFSIGAFNDGSNAHDGQIADFAFWKGYALTDAEIKSLACALPIQRQGIVSYWKGADTADSIGTNTLTNNNSATFTAGQVGNAFTLNGSNQSLSIADNASLDIDGEISIIMWEKPTAVSRTQSMLSKGEDNYEVSANSSNNILFYLDSSSIVNTTTYSTLTVDTWKHDVLIATGAQCYRYQNGVLIDTLTSTKNPTPNNTALSIGNGDLGYWQGQLNEILLSARYWRPEEVKAVYLKGLNGKEATSTEIPDVVNDSFEATVLEITAALELPTISRSESFTATALEITSSLKTVTVTRTESFTAAALGLSLSLKSPLVTRTESFDAAVIALTSAVKDVTISRSESFEDSVHSLSFGLNPVQNWFDYSTGVSALELTLAIGSQEEYYDYDVFLSAIGATLSVIDPAVALSPNIFPYALPIRTWIPKYDKFRVTKQHIDVDRGCPFCLERGTI